MKCLHETEIDREQLLRDKAAYIAERSGVDAATQAKVWEADHEFWMTRPHWVVLAFQAMEGMDEEVDG